MTGSSARVLAAAEPPVDIGNRIEMFVDRYLLAELKGAATLQLTNPERREVVFTTNKPWEGPSSAYFSVIQNAGVIRLYYRGYCPEDADNRQVTCYAESRDGVNFIRPDLGLYAFDGSSHNNIIWQGIESHNFAPFLDTNPAAEPGSAFKALAGINGKLYAFKSGDGIHWTRMSETPVITDGAFDSLNTAFWDRRGYYRCYSRYWDDHGAPGVRAIQSCTSTDFIHWTKPVPNQYSAGAPREQFYTNATRPVPGAEHQLLSFPKRFVPERTRRAGYKEPGVSDAMLMASRDGVQWDRAFLDAWVRPGQDELNWTQRSNMPAAGIVSVDSDCFSMYISRHYQWPDNGLQRITIRKYGFGSIHSGRAGGEMITKPFVVRGSTLQLNMATSAAGAIQVEVQSEAGTAIDGFKLADCSPLFGDRLNENTAWRGNADLTPLIGKTVRLRFVMSDADLYAIKIAAK